MIILRQKNYTIQEGHFTGTKDEDRIPGAVEVIGKSALGGAILGGIIGKLDKKSTVKEGAITGAKVGTIAGIALKFLVNYLHKPMSRVKYQEVDKGIRREYGIYKAAGITLGDKLDKRATMEERFAFNDRNVCSYKICFAVQDNQVTMYTYDLTDEELEKVNKHLDYYCKKYYGMEYSAALINQKLNSYSVAIVFTNYQVISNFMVELSELLKTKIDLLDSNALVKGRFITEEESEKSFSVKPLNKYEVLKILGRNGFKATLGLFLGRGFSSVPKFVINSIHEVCTELTAKDMANAGIPVPRKFYTNTYLEDTLKKLHYVEGFNFTISEKDAKNNMSMINGLFVVTTEKDSNDMKAIDKNYWNSMKGKIVRSEKGKAIIYTYSFQGPSEFEMLLKKLMSTKITFNIFEG